MENASKTLKEIRLRVSRASLEQDRSTGLLDKLRRECSHEQVVATHYDDGCHHHSESGVCLDCGLREDSGLVHDILMRLPRETVQWVANDVFEAKYATDEVLFSSKSRSVRRHKRSR